MGNKIEKSEKVIITK